ncbi:MAG TPA: EF-hand domain-containing protein [Allosphingosinicella sp.]|jgi:hypothetical protein
MLRFAAGVASALLLVVGGFFLWKSRAEAEDPIPPAPRAAAVAPASFLVPQREGRPPQPPAASEKSKEEKRFARADKNDDGRITLAELYEPRRKAFGKLDTNGNGSLSFEEWAESTSEKFAKADADRSGWLTPREYETTKPKTRPKPKCKC